MFVNPKITLTPRVADPATVVRKARVLLDHQLRQDAAYNRPVSRVNYRIGDVSCQITHEFGQTYIALDQVVIEATQLVKHPQPYQFLTVVSTGNLSVYNSSDPNSNVTTAWLSRDAQSWTQAPSSSFMQALFNISGELQATQATYISQYYLFAAGVIGAASVVSWSLFNLPTLSNTPPVPFPPVPGYGPVQNVEPMAYVGGTVMCMPMMANETYLLVWFDWVAQEYVYIIPFSAFGLTGSLGPYAEVASLTRAPGAKYAQVAMAYLVNTGVTVWTADLNTQTWAVFGTLTSSEATAGSYTQPLAGMAPGANGTLAIAAQGAASNVFTELFTAAPLSGPNYAAGQFPYAITRLIYSPLGWAFPSAPTAQGLTFLSSSGRVVAVPAPRQMPAYVSCLVNTPVGVFDLAAGVLYQNTTGPSLALPLPPYADPQNPNYAFGQPNVTVACYYFGPGVFPELNLY